MSVARFRFGEFEFDAASGELRRRSGADGEPAQRLAPQPACVLGLLLDRRGGLVGREEIRSAVWPGVEVDFDTSLHFCIRQIRAALEDSATAPRYIETLPRRGYRLIPEVQPLDEPRVEPARKRFTLALALGLGGLTLLALWLANPGFGQRTDPTPPGIAIMPFISPADTAGIAGATPLADRILEELATRAGQRARLVGPTTTRAYARSDVPLGEFTREYELDYIVNGRFIDDEHGPRMLAELIRTSDGAHVWVEAYRDLGDTDRIGTEIAAAVLGRLDLAD